MRLNEFCKTCKHKAKDKNIDEPCKRCAGTHVNCNYLFYEHEGCEFCDPDKISSDYGTGIKEWKFLISLWKPDVQCDNENIRMIVEYEGDERFDDAEFSIKHCLMCGRKLN